MYPSTSMLTASLVTMLGVPSIVNRETQALYAGHKQVGKILLRFNSGDSWTTGDDASLTIARADGSISEVVAYTIQASDTDNEVATGWCTEFNDNAEAGIIASAMVCDSAGAEDDTGEYVLVSGYKVGDAFTLTVGTFTESADVTQSAFQTASEGTSTAFGRIVCRQTTKRLTQVNRHTGDVVAAPLSSDFTAMQMSWAITYAAGARYWVEATYADTTILVGPVVASVDDAGTAAAIASAFETQSNSTYGAAMGLIGDNSTGTFRITVDVPGAVFKARVWVEGSATADVGVPTGEGRADDPTYSLPASVAGVIERMEGFAPTTIGGVDEVIEPGSIVKLLTDGEIPMYLSYSTAPTYGSGSYVGVATATTGLAYAANAANRVPLWHPKYGWLAVWRNAVDEAATLVNLAFKTIR